MPYRSVITNAFALVCLTLFGASSVAGVLAGDTSVNLPMAATTSAGIFDKSGHLIRTLWRGQHHEAGSVAIHWDGKNDDGKLMSSNSIYTARVLAHNIKYVWEGVIGNTSRTQTGTMVHRAYLPINDMAFDRAGNAFYVVGYNEQQPALRRFNTKDPQAQSALLHDDWRRVFRYVATDGRLAYFANIGLHGNRGTFTWVPKTFVVAAIVADGKEYDFPEGKLEFDGIHFNNRWGSVIDYADDEKEVADGFKSAASGLAVQLKGNILFVAHAGENAIRLFDKRSGRLLSSLSAPAPGSIATAPDDSLWVICKRNNKPVVLHYAPVRGVWNSDTEISANLQIPVAIAVSPVDGTVLIADNGTEQLNAYAPTGAPAWTLGSQGGYRTGGPIVTTDKLWLSAAPTYVAFEMDGSFWVGDTGNYRNLHYSADRRYLGQIMYLPASYSMAVDPIHPERVYSNYFEFAVDYSKPIGSSWTLVRNWAAGIDSNYLNADHHERRKFQGIGTPVTLANGRTYATVLRNTPGSREVVELTATGLRFTGKLLEFGRRLYGDGSLRTYSESAGRIGIYAQPLTGFDDKGNPQWGPQQQLAAASAVKNLDPYPDQVPKIWGVNEPAFPDVLNGLLISFNPGMASGFHLGGIRRGANDWLWKASPSGQWQLNSEGEIVTHDGTYELGRGVNYPGNMVTTAGHHVIYGYHGEVWNQGEANQFMHFLDNGLFVGQFGHPVYPSENRFDARPERAGNAFSHQLVEVGGQVYLWHNDESVHAGVHRWKIQNANDYDLIDAPIQP